MSRTRSTWIRLLAGGVLLSAGCGEGRAIFNVDVLSYDPTLADTVPYSVPGGTSLPQISEAFSLNLPPGLGNSSVDSVTLQYGATVLNTAGGGKFKVEFFFGSDSATVFSSSVVQADSVIVAGPDTQVIGPISVPLLADTLFTQDQLWVGVRASVTADPGPTLTGRAVPVSILRLRVVVQDKIF
jgi:hypothetical protein